MSSPGLAAPSPPQLPPRLKSKMTLRRRAFGVSSGVTMGPLVGAAWRRDRDKGPDATSSRRECKLLHTRLVMGVCC